MNDPDEFVAYLRVKAKVDELTREFYGLQKWRNWKFRLYCGS